jgi:hypothetical protein
MAFASAILSLALAAGAYAPKNDFAVIVTVYRGMSPLWTYSLSGDSISVTRHFADGRREATALKRGLTQAEVRRLDRFFTRFPLPGVKPRYADERVDGDSCLRYLVKVNGSERESYVCYARPAELADLDRAISRLLPRQYRLWLEE